MSKSPIPVSAIVMTKNESANIEKCLRSLARFDEAFVVDSGSTDDTCEIARRMGARVVPFSWNGQYPKKKQWCLENLPFRNDWILNVDADEEVTPELAAEIASAVADPRAAAGFFISYDYVFMGKALRHGQKMIKLALFDRHRGRFPEFDDLEATNSGEVELHFQPQIDGPTRKLRAAMLHADHDRLYDFFDRHNRYSDWEAVVRRKGVFISQGDTQLRARRYLKKIFNALPCKAVVWFVFTYLVRLGVLDGRAGFQYALAKTFYFWQIELKMHELKSSDIVAESTGHCTSYRELA